MKKIYTALALLSLTVGHLLAQNWSPLLVSETHHFRLPNAQHITHTLRIDSTTALPNGSMVFHLNRVMRRWTEEDSAYAWVSQGQFLGQTATRMADGRWVFYGVHKLNTIQDFTVIPTASLGQSWAVNSGQTASVTAVSWGEILGEPDSLKTIQFSSGAVWVLSKSHGLVSCPDPFSGSQVVQLSGLETKQLGDRLYRFDDFFPYEVGDVLEFTSSAYNFLGWKGEHSKQVVIKKAVLPNSVTYTMRRKSKMSSTGFGGNQSWVVNDTTKWVIYPSVNYLNIGAYPNQVSQPEWGAGQVLATMFDGGLRIGVDCPNPGEGCYCVYHEMQPEDDRFGTPNLLVSYGGKFYDEYRKGVGRVAFHVNVIDDQRDWNLLGAVVQGDTVWGKISPDWLFTSTQTPGEDDRLLRVTPNPAQDEAFVQLPETFRQGPLMVQILSSEGQLLRQWAAQPEGNVLQIDLTDIPPQICTVMLRASEGVWHGRVIRSR